MNKKTIIVWALVGIGFVGFVTWNRSNQIAHPQTGQLDSVPSILKTSEKFFDFKTISMANGLVNHAFTITNSTNTSIDLKSISTSCMCTTAYLETTQGEQGPFGMPGMGYNAPVRDVIKPGESRTIKVVYNPNAHGPAGIGTIDRFVYIEDASGGTLQFEIKAFVTP